VTTISVTGSAFKGPQNIRTPLALGAGQSATFFISFAPADAVAYSGTLAIDTRVFSLAGRGFVAPLPKPILGFDSAAIGSAQQHTLTMTLPTASPVTVSGSVNLSFTSATPMIKDDPAVIFVSTGTRTLPFFVKEGDTQVVLNGQPGAVFQTGTTAGTITFTVNASATGVTGDPTTIVTIAPRTISVSTATASARPGSLDIEIIGYDNTYTAGVMSFIFYDAKGEAIDPGAIQADFTAAFRSYFIAQQGGSAFLMRVSFPVTGSASQVTGADVALTNSSGAMHLERLSFIANAISF
jgi:hypothetical protein